MLKITYNNSQGQEQVQMMGISKAGKFAYEMERLGIRVKWSMLEDFKVEDNITIVE